MTGCIIGSFRKYYDDIVTVIEEFEQNGVRILSPKVSTIINPGDEFVILASDNAELTKEQIQAQVFENEKKSDFVYVWNPEGYLGRTTCYEIGRIVERGDKPIYYKDVPKDLPIVIDEANILEVSELIAMLTDQGNGSLEKIDSEGSHSREI